ncbi:MAG: fatty acid cis/trans isomerase [Glaciecola sp.]
MNNILKSIIILLALIIAASIYQYYSADIKAKPILIPVPTSAQNIDYHNNVKPVIQQRCVVCHACYDAPCQLKMGSYAGISRGANSERVYNGERLVEANLTRLFEDAHTQSQWRDKGFFPVVNDAASTSKNAAHENVASSVLAHLLHMKQQQAPESTGGKTNKLNEKDYPLDLNREYQCPTTDTIGEYTENYSKWGMPYGLPKLSESKHNTLMTWIAQGAQGNDKVEVSDTNQRSIERWEAFFNGNDLKTQLMSRYLFEHLFLVHLHFDATSPQQYFKLVRSSTAPGMPVNGIYTRRPFDNPNTERVYYRIVPVQQTVVHKSHMPMLLNDERMTKWKTWFINTQYEVTSLPSYLPEEASNPFITFAQIPLNSRYKYMLDESQNTIMQFIKGPVCRGQMALNVINDHFWVVFAGPDLNVVQNSDAFMREARQKITLPAEQESNALPTAWMNYAAMEREYLNAKSLFIENHLKNKVSVDLDLLWDGNQTNDNMALTIFRHNDAASVVKGLVGNNPQTAWVLTYPLFERIHYLLVAGYDVYGNLGHQLNSRMYMDFLRMEGEFNFLAFLPKDTQKEVRAKWYRGSVSEVEKFVYEGNSASLTSDISFTTNRPYTELLAMLKDKFDGTRSERHSLSNSDASKTVKQAFAKINTLQGENVSLLPESTIVRVVTEKAGQQQFFTMLRHSAHSNISHLFNEADRRLPSEDTVTIANGFMTSHPNAFLQIKHSEIADFAEAVENLSSEQDYSILLDNYGIRRTHPQFWEYADIMHEYFAQHYPVEFGYLDFNRLENR